MVIVFSFIRISLLSKIVISQWGIHVSKHTHIDWTRDRAVQVGIEFVELGAQTLL